jgi:hypothetical protein
MRRGRRTREESPGWVAASSRYYGVKKAARGNLRRVERERQTDKTRQASMASLPHRLYSFPSSGKEKSDSFLHLHVFLLCPQGTVSLKHSLAAAFSLLLKGIHTTPYTPICPNRFLYTLVPHSSRHRTRAQPQTCLRLSSPGAWNNVLNTLATAFSTTLATGPKLRSIFVATNPGCYCSAAMRLLRYVYDQSQRGSFACPVLSSIAASPRSDMELGAS